MCWQNCTSAVMLPENSEWSSFFSCLQFQSINWAANSLYERPLFCDKIYKRLANWLEARVLPAHRPGWKTRAREKEKQYVF
jgi:hypothetical protein